MQPERDGSGSVGGEGLDAAAPAPGLLAFARTPPLASTDSVDTKSGPAERSLDWLNFFLADVRDGLGPYLAIYLLAVQHWDAASIGLVMTIGGLAGLLTQTPAGALI